MQKSKNKALILKVVVIAILFLVLMASIIIVVAPKKAEAAGYSEIKIKFNEEDIKGSCWVVDFAAEGYHEVNFTNFIDFSIVNPTGGLIYGFNSDTIYLNSRTDSTISLNFTPQIKVKTTAVPQSSFQPGMLKHNVNLAYTWFMVNGNDIDYFFGNLLIYASLLPGHSTKTAENTYNLSGNKFNLSYSMFTCIDPTGSYNTGIAREEIKFSINFNIKPDSKLTKNDMSITRTYYDSLSKTTKDLIAEEKNGYSFVANTSTSSYRLVDIVLSTAWKNSNPLGTIENSYFKVIGSSTYTYNRQRINTGDLEANVVNTVTPYTWTNVAGDSLYFIKDTYSPDVENTQELKGVFLPAAQNATILTNTLSSLAKTDSTSNKNCDLGGTNKDVRFKFSSTTTQATETAVYTFTPFVLEEGKIKLDTKNIENNIKYTSNTYLSRAGKYELTISDTAGNKTVITFFINKDLTSYNYNNIAEYSYVDFDHYIVVMPGNVPKVDLSIASKLDTNNIHIGSFINSQKYLFKNIEDAKQLAFELETEFYVTKTGSSSWSYKVPNSSLTMEYTDIEILKDAIRFYADRYVSQNEIKQSSPYLDFTKNTIMDNSLKLNNAENTTLSYNGNPVSLIKSDFKFTKNLITTLNSKSYYDSVEFSITDLSTGKIIEGSYSKDFSKIDSSIKEGYYLIKETDSFGNIIQYYVYLDLTSPVLYSTYSTFTSEDIQREITDKDTLDLYLNTFTINDVVDFSDSFTFVKIEGSKINGIFYENFPELEGGDATGAGKYKITVFDRSLNSFTFEIYLYGQAPTTTFTTSGSGPDTTLRLRIGQGAAYNIITDIKIYRNDKLLNDPDGYREREDSEPIYISNANLNYTFTLGGVYVVEITDNFGRVTRSKEYKFIKDMPEITLSGVLEGRITANNVTIKFPSDCDYILMKDGIIQEVNDVTDITTGKKIITIMAAPETSGGWYIKVIKQSDPDSFNFLSFGINKIPPEAKAYDVFKSELSQGAAVNAGVYITVADLSNLASIAYKMNGSILEKTYKIGEILSKDGEYAVLVKDKQGNITYLYFTIDTLCGYEIALPRITDKLLKIDDKNGVTAYITNKDFSLKQLEELYIELYFNGNKNNCVSGQTLTAEGEYHFKLTDKFGNTAEFIIVIDKTPPSYVININSNITNENVLMSFLKLNDISDYKLTFNNKNQTYILMSENIFTAHGSYKLTLKDIVGNEVILEFVIDKEVEFDIDVFNGGITADNVSLKAHENLKITAYYNGEEIDFNYSQEDKSLSLLNNRSYTFKDIGLYHLIITDELGNVTEISFMITQKVKSAFYYELPEGVVLQEIKKDNKAVAFEFTDKIDISEDGSYKITFYDVNLNKTFKFDFEIDTVAPIAELVNVSNGGTTTKDVELKNISKKCSVEVYLNDNLIKYNSSNKLTENGTYRVVLIDSAGNVTEYTFTKTYAVNTAGKIFIAIAIIAVLAFTIVFIKVRYKTKIK